MKLFVTGTGISAMTWPVDGPQLSNVNVCSAGAPWWHGQHIILLAKGPTRPIVFYGADYPGEAGLRHFLRSGDAQGAFGRRGEKKKPPPPPSEPPRSHRRWRSRAMTRVSTETTRSGPRETARHGFVTEWPRIPANAARVFRSRRYGPTTTLCERERTGF